MPSNSRMPLPEVLMSLKIAINQDQMGFVSKLENFGSHCLNWSIQIMRVSNPGLYIGTYLLVERSSILSLASSSSADVSCQSTWQPSSFFLTASFDEEKTILCRILDFSGDQAIKVN